MSIFSVDNLPSEPKNKVDKPLILLVDDEKENISVLKQLLESQFEILTSFNGLEAIELIDNLPEPTKIQLIITDQRMPKMTGVEFLENIVERMPDTIRIILTGYSDTQVIIDAINKAKLYKFMTKPFDPIELSLTVKRGVEAYQMRQSIIDYAANLEQLVEKRTAELNSKNVALTEALDSLERLSLSDQLTGVNNRHFLQKAMIPELARLKREYSNVHEHSFGLMMVDIDFFKKVNDKYGHDAGDQVLVQFSKIIQDCCRESDWIARWGGEEFVIVARDSDMEGLELLAQRINGKVNAYKFDIGCGQSISCSCSIGLVGFPFVKGNFELLTWEQTLNFADLALYLAKNNGRNTWVSLIEKESKKFLVDRNLPLEDFYKQVNTNLVELIDSGAIIYHTPISSAQLAI